MGYTGTIVVGRQAGLLVHADGMDGFGHRHRYLRELGGGWQMVETGGWSDAPDLSEPCRRLAASTGHPVLAAHVLDSDYALLWTGDRPIDLRDIDDAVAALTAWSAGAGLAADPAAIRSAITADTLADDIVFDLVRALGAERIGRTLPRTFPIEMWPFASMASLAYHARMKAFGREAYGDADDHPEQPWEAPAIALDRLLWSLAFRSPVDAESLARKAVEVLALRDATRGARPDDEESDTELLDSLIAKGRLAPEPPDAQERAWADRRATA